MTMTVESVAEGVDTISENQSDGQIGHDHRVSSQRE